ncbi:hypothetical protein XU06_03170 [Rhodococcus erythropolis]|nr:hypothetical protein XU06_03170 [Rhodococcus erythropolis]
MPITTCKQGGAEVSWLSTPSKSPMASQMEIRPTLGQLRRKVEYGPVMGRLTELLKSVKKLGSRKDTAAKQEKRALDRWENEGGPVAEDPRQR